MKRKCCVGRHPERQTQKLNTKKLETKVVFLGDSGVGKSSLLLRYIRNEFSEAFEVTIGGAFLQTSVDLGEGEVVTLDIWDTAGQERFRSLMPLYYRDASAAVVVYDVMDQISFDRCEHWVSTLKTQEPNCILFLVGNKADVESSVDEWKVKAFAAENCMEWLLTSAKADMNVQSLFRKVAEGIKEQHGISGNI